MTNSDQSLPKAPPGIDPDVQAKIGALIAQNPTTITARKIPRGRRNNGGVSCLDATTTQKDILGGPTCHSTRLPTNQPDVNMFQLGEKPEHDDDESTWHDCEAGDPPPLSPREDVLHLANTSEVSRSKAVSNRVTTDVFPPTHAIPAPALPSPSPSSGPLNVIKRAVSYIGNYWCSWPEIIEYSDAEIARKTEVCIEAQEWFATHLPNRDFIIKVVAIVRDISPASARPGEYEVVERPVEILAKHKRVREIKRSFGCYDAEDFYRRDISVALARLNR